MIFDRKDHRAFTLTEVMVGMVLLILVWLVALNVVIVSRASGSLAKHKIQAQYVIQQTIENMRKLQFSSLAGGTTIVSIDTRGTPDITADDLIGTRVVTVTTLDAYYKKVVVQITWQESFFGKSKNVTESCGTYIANDPQAN